MGMIVKHNLTAMNSNRMLGLTTTSQAKATEKLSSGYKINRAADDAAGLAISEKMRKQIRGLTQASLNAQDGVSAVQTADGALNEVHDMIQRLTELSVKAANGTLSESDRGAVQNEVDQLVAEIDRVSTTTKFNETHLLRGTNANGKAGELTYTDAATALNGKLGTGSAVDTVKGTVDVAITSPATVQITTVTPNITATGKSVGPVNLPDGTLKTYYLIESAVPTSASEAIRAYNEDASNAPSKAYGSMSELTAALKADYSENIRAVTTYLDDNGDLTLKAETFADLNNPVGLDLHVGADSTDDNKIYMNISMLSAKGLGLNGLNVSGDNADAATAAIDVVADALQRVSNQRASLGAIQNRLEHTIANLDNIVENTTSAEASIRDTDMATQMVEYSNNQILAQAGQAMLAQSNQATSGVLSLLQ